MRRIALIAAPLVLQACGSAPPAPATGPAAAPGAVAAVAAPAVADPVDVFERRQRERAETAARQGRLGDAAFAWEVLAALRPQRSGYRERLVATQAQVQAAVAERLPKAAAAHKRGEFDTAAQLYLGVLALDPANEAAADGLRAIERERVKRSHLGRFARDTLARRPAEHEQRAAAPRPIARATAPVNGRGDGDRNTVEHASMLASQGELDDAIALLQVPATAPRNDPDARRLLAALLVQKADRLLPSDRAGAIGALERSLQLDAAQPAVRQRLQALRDGSAPSTGAPAASAPSPRKPAMRQAAPNGR